MSEDRVLLVDDEEEFVIALSKRLRARKLEVSTAADGEAALAAVRKNRYDAIILDLAMPGMNGLETLQRIREVDREVQVILLTGHGTVQTGTEAMRLGAMDFLEKPADFEDLLARIKEAVAKKLRVVDQHSEEQVAAILRSKGW
jgi:DNA-binding NtrC family response regulator